MISHLQPSVASKKVMELRSALFFNTSTSVLKIQNRVINALYADEIGQVWFCIPPPFTSVHEVDREFSANLDFFKKEKEFYLKITGKTFIVNDPEELNHLSGISPVIKQSIRKGECILLKLQIKDAVYFERQSCQRVNHFEELKNLLHKWFAKWQKVNVKKISLNNLIHLPNIFSN
jgi:general stress protein 26